jgi:hypothetical protein
MEISPQGVMANAIPALKVRGFSAFLGEIAGRVPFRHSAIHTKFGVHVTNVPDRAGEPGAIAGTPSTAPRNR